MWGHLLFYHLKCFLRITPLRKQLNPSKPNIKVIQQTTDAIFVQNQRDGINFGQIKSNVNKINQIASLKCQNLLTKLYSKYTQVVADMSIIAHSIHRSRESCVFKTKVKKCFLQHKDWSAREWFESTSNATNKDSQCWSCSGHIYQITSLKTV